MERLAAEIMRLFALALDLPENWFDDKVDEHMTNLTANYYPAQIVPPRPGQLRKGQHSDWGSLTILYQDDAPGGLQVLGKGGTWVSTVHRVVNPPRDVANTERYSGAFFHQPNFDARIECIPTCTGPSNPPRYAPTYSGEYIVDKFRRAYGW
jgi:isopenicillin N synthase-like dioxygenase